MLLLLTHRQFRLLWSAGAVVNFGGFIFWVVQGWLTLTVTDSPFWLGAAIGVWGLGMMCFSIPGGVLADTLDRRGLSASAAVARGVLMGLLAVPIFLDQVQLWHILVVSFLVGIGEAVAAPAFTALTLDVVGKGRLLAANAANFAALGVAGVVMPISTAAVVNTWGIAWAFVASATMFTLGGAFLSVLSRPDSSAAPTDSTSPRRQAGWPALKQGVAYVFSTPVVRTLILMGLVGELFGWAHVTMLPAMARDVLGTGVSGFGYLASAGFLGMLVSTLVISSLGDVRKKGRFMVIGGVGFTVFVILFALSRSFPLSLALLATAYGLGAMYEVSLNTLVQTVVPDEMRGRVISFQALTWGVNGVSGFHTGAIASRLGPPLVTSRQVV